MTVALTDQEFEKFIKESDKPVLVDFWAQWCGPCLTVAPMLEELSQEYKDQVVIAKVNIDENPDTAAKLGIRSIPTMILFKDADIADIRVGASPKADLEEWLKGQVSN